jgi:urease accessory protein
LSAKYERRALRVGVAGPVGTGKSSLIAAVCREMSATHALGVVTNDIYTDEDARFLRREGVLAAERIVAVQTGCCPHTAIRDDPSANLQAVEELEAREGPLDIVLVESGGDNLTATFSPVLADVQIFVLDCAGGDDVPRKGGPGIARADLLVINKADLAPFVGSDVTMMVRDAEAQRGGRSVLTLSLRPSPTVAPLIAWISRRLQAWVDGTLESVDPGPPAPHGHGPVAVTVGAEHNHHH